MPLWHDNQEDFSTQERSAQKRSDFSPEVWPKHRLVQEEEEEKSCSNSAAICNTHRSDLRRCENRASSSKKQPLSYRELKNKEKKEEGGKTERGRKEKKRNAPKWRSRKRSERSWDGLVRRAALCTPFYTPKTAPPLAFFNGGIGWCLLPLLDSFTPKPPSSFPVLPPPSSCLLLPPPPKYCHRINSLFSTTTKKSQPFSRKKNWN